MRCLEYSENGAAWDVIRQVVRPSPSPGADQVLVALEAAPIHIADLKAIEGNLDFIAPGAGTPGFEGVGRIIACGQNVQGWKSGDRVILPLSYGAWQEHRAVPAIDLWRAPEHVPAELSATQRARARIARARSSWLRRSADDAVKAAVSVLRRGRDPGIQVVAAVHST